LCALKSELMTGRRTALDTPQDTSGELNPLAIALWERGKRKVLVSKWLLCGLRFVIYRNNKKSPNDPDFYIAIESSKKRLVDLVYDK
jgi:hypothetical protein